MTAEELRSLSAAVKSRGRMPPFPARLEQSYWQFVREHSQGARFGLIVLSLIGFALAPLPTWFAPYTDEATRQMLLALEIGVMIPLLGLAAIAQWREPLRAWSEWLIVLAYVGHIICVEVMLHVSTQAGVPITPVVAVVVPVAVLALARLPANRVSVILGTYIAVAALGALFGDSAYPVRRIDHWVVELIILNVMVLSSFWSKGIMRRQWAGNALLEMMAYRDALTGLPNRRAFEEHYDVARRALARSQTRTALLALIDLDHFKRINDHYGHSYGDGVLAEVGLTLAQFSRRSMDMSARLGGEEFALLLYACDLEAAKNRLGELQATIRALAIEHQGNDPQIVTCSVGAVIVSPEDELADAYHTADQRLYHIKHHGRNGTSIAATVER